MKPILALSALLIACGPGPQPPARRATGPRPIPRRARRAPALPAPQVTIGEVSVDCLEPTCLTQALMPAIARDGKVVAIVATFPFASAHGGSLGEYKGTRFDLVRFKDGKVLKTYPLINSDDITSAHTETRPDCCSDDPNARGCDPRLCPAVPKLVEKHEKELLATMKERLASVNRALRSRPFLPLDPVREAAEKKKGQKGLIYTTKVEGKITKVRIIDAKTGELHFRLSLKKGYTAATLEDGKVWLSPHKKLLVVEISGCSGRGCASYFVEYLTQKLQ